ncbi:hypothetical protein FACUT_5235 [Fusarium acutatum]|uniref:Uncharacterized protein n=1 Tax=Fusarium acutatum TaxID=78861 RepID=A0A8H4JUR5_9HYPO|nr:hypothetical protein FACUT_5235 [Fusarium acutatum]
MLNNWLLKLDLLAMASLLRLVTAGADQVAAYGSVVQQQPLNPPSAVANDSLTIEGEELLDECDPTISICGTTADVKVIRTHKSTSYVTKVNEHVVITTLPTSTRTVFEVIVSTNTTSIEGQCRDTIVYEEIIPTTVVVEINTTTTREFVPIVPTTVTTVSWVEHKKISQCIIKRTSTGLAPGPGYGSAASPPSPPSQHPPPPASSGGNYNSGQPAPSIPPAGGSSGQGGGSQRYVHVDEHFDQRPRNFADVWLTVDLLVLHHLPLPSSRPPPPLKACPGACMEAHLETFLGPQELQLAQVLQELRVPRVLPRPLHLRPREALLDSRLVIKLHADGYSLVETSY